VVDLDCEAGLDAVGAIGQASFARVVEILTAKRARRIVEFGSGRSSVRLEAALDAHITSVEHDPTWADAVRRAAKTARLEVVSLPLEMRAFGGHTLLGYAAAPWTQPLDAVLIDGPPYWTVRGRETCLYDIYDRLPVGAVVFLDDCWREGERSALRNWSAVYEGSFEVRIEHGSHGLAILEKVAHVEPRWAAAERVADAESVASSYAELRTLLTNIGGFRLSTWPLDDMVRAYRVPEGPGDRRALRASLTRLGEILRPLMAPGSPP
jgi:predicted O-methyltransferase YrrM